MTISLVPQAILPETMSGRLQGFRHFPRRVGSGTWYPHHPRSQGNRFILSVIDHLTRFVILIAIKSKAVCTIVHLIARVFSVFGPPETLYSDRGKEFENELVKELQSVFGYKKTRTAAFRPQGNSVLERACTQHCPQYVGYV